MIHKAYMPVNKIFIADRASQVVQEDLKKIVSFHQMWQKLQLLEWVKKGHKWTRKGYKWTKKKAKNGLYFVFSPPSISCQPPLVFLSDDIFMKNPKGKKDKEKGFVCMIFYIARSHVQHITF